MAFTHSPKIVQDGLVFYVDAANPRSYNSGSSDTFNLIDKNITGSLINNTVFVDSNQGVWEVDGVDDLIEIEAASALNPTTAITIETWVKPNVSQTQAYPVLICKGTINDNYLIFLEGGKAHFRISYSPTYDTKGSTDLRDGQWHHVVGTFDGTTLYIYVDGILENSEAPVDAAIETEGITAVGIGATVAQTDEFTGQIALTRIYNKGFTAADVLQNFNAQKGRFT